MFEKYLDDYYKCKIKISNIVEKEDINPSKFYTWLKQRGLFSYQEWTNKLNLKNNKLNKNCRQKYSAMVSRCSGKDDKYGHYNGMEYPSIITYVEFCNNNKDVAEKIWEKYIGEGRNLKYALSIDRIDDTKGYTPDNMQFVTHGFNSWKRNLDRPIKAKFKDSAKWDYFMSCAEGCRYYNIRDRDFGEILNNTRYHNTNYDIEVCTIEDVLTHNNCKTIEEYYDKFIK